MRFTTRPTEPVADPLALDPTTVWMSPEVSLWGWGEALRLRPGPGHDRFQRMWQEFSDRTGPVQPSLGGGPVLFASVSFAAESAASVGVVPEVLLSRRGDAWWLTTVDGAALPAEVPSEPEPDRPRYAGSSMPDLVWLEAVAEAVRRIEAGALDKVVLARDYAVWSRTQFHPPRLLRRLHRHFPDCHVFRVADLVGASPELLARRRGSLLESLVLAGTAPSYADPEADAASARALAASSKDRWEHELAVRSVTETLERFTSHAVVSPAPELLRLDNVRHLATPVTAELDEPLGALEIAGRLHPTAAVGGTPTATAVDLIDEIEGMDRGRYAGPVGWVSGDGDGEFAIALRCAELSGARARLFAGAGIVAGSLPEAELDETRTKLEAMMGALRPEESGGNLADRATDGQKDPDSGG